MHLSHWGKTLYLVLVESAEIESFSRATALRGIEPQWREQTGSGGSGNSLEIISPSPPSPWRRWREEHLSLNPSHTSFFLSFFFLLQPTDNINATHLFDGIRGISLLSIWQSPASTTQKSLLVPSPRTRLVQTASTFIQWREERGRREARAGHGGERSCKGRDDPSRSVSWLGWALSDPLPSVWGSEGERSPRPATGRCKVRCHAS